MKQFPGDPHHVASELQMGDMFSYQVCVRNIMADILNATSQVSGNRSLQIHLMILKFQHHILMSLLPILLFCSPILFYRMC